MKLPPLVLLLFLLGLTLLRAVVSAQDPLSSAEAYRFLIAVKWEWASFDGPGGVTGLIHVLAHFLGASGLGVRLPGILILLLGSLALFRLAKLWGGDEAACWVVLAWSVLPAFNTVANFSDPLIVGAGWVPVILLAAWRASEEEGWLGWVWAGLALAAGAMLSYWNVLAFIGLLLLPALFRRHRGGSLWPGTILATLIGLTGLLGPLIWNSQTQWLAFSENTLQTLLWPAPFSSSGRSLQAALQTVSFLIGLGLLIIFVAAAKEARKSTKARFAFALSSPFLLASFYLLYHAGTPSGVLLASAPALLTLAAARLFESGKTYMGDLPLPVARGAALIAVLIASFHSAVNAGFHRTGMDEPDWKGLSARLERALLIHQPAGEESLFLIAADPNAAAALGYWMVTHAAAPRMFPPVFLRESQNVANQYGLWHRYDAFVEGGESPDRFFTEQKGVNPYLGRSALYLGDEAPADLPQTIADGFELVLPLERITIDSRDGGRVDLYLYFCGNYETAPL